MGTGKEKFTGDHVVHSHSKCALFMRWGLKRYCDTEKLHFITWSCFERKPVLGTPERRDLLLDVLERMRVGTVSSWLAMW